jgi:hypothetical protein
MENREVGPALANRKSNYFDRIKAKSASQPASAGKPDPAAATLWIPDAAHQRKHSYDLRCN